MSQLMPLSIDTSVGRRPATLALPDGPGPHPGVVVIHDIFGMQPDTGRHCLNFAAAGYAAIAPDLYAEGNVGCVVRTLWSMQTERGEAFEVIAGARRALAERDDVEASRIAVTGFCMGGGFALLAAADDTYAVAAPFYGTTPRQTERLQGVCPTLGQYGGLDVAFRLHAARLDKHLTRLGVEHEVLVHPGVGHSFMNDHGGWLMKVSGWLPPMFAGHDLETERLAWATLLDFFERHMPATEPLAAP